MKLYFLPIAVLLASCATTFTHTGEPRVSMGDSYEKVLATLTPNHNITRTIEGRGIRAEGYSSMMNACRVKYFIFQDNDGLQQVKYEPAPSLSKENKCR